MKFIRFVIAWLARVSVIVDEKNLGLVAAGVAFYSILSVFPGLAALIALWGVIGDPGLLASELPNFAAFLPQQVAEIIQGQLRSLASADGLTLGWTSFVSFILAIWTARVGVAALMRGLNAIYGVPNRSGFAHYLMAVGLTLALIGVALVALLCVVVLPLVLAYVPVLADHQLSIDVVRWILALAVLMAGFSLIYRLGPNARGRQNVPGALFATLLWAGVSFGFSLYLENFASYNEVYGSLGAVIALMMWLFLSAWLVLLGGALNAFLSQGQQPDP